jgi:hypothetical protein
VRMPAPAKTDLHEAKNDVHHAIPQPQDSCRPGPANHERSWRLGPRKSASRQPKFRRFPD